MRTGLSKKAPVRHENIGLNALQGKLIDMMVKIIIPNWNGAELLEECFQGIREQTFRDYSITVVDNGSIDNSVEIIRRVDPEIEIIALPTNQGFAGAVNKGVEPCMQQARYLLLLNNDVYLEKDCLDVLVRYMEENERVMGVNPKLINYFERNRIDTFGIYFRHWKAFDIATGVIDEGQYPSHPFEIFGCNMGASIFRSRLFEEVGLLDNTFFAQYEDVDFAMRSRWRGFSFHCLPEARAYHRRGWTAHKDKPFAHALARRNDMYCAIKNFPAFMLFLKLFYSLLRDMPQLVQSPFRKKFRKKYNMYFEIFSNMKEMLGKRKRIMRVRSIPSRTWKQLFKTLPDYSQINKS